MSASEAVIHEVLLLQIEAPDGNVNLCGGGFIDFDAGNGLERFDAEHPVYGVIVELDAFERAIKGQAESSSLALAPNPEAPLSAWYREDLAFARVRSWIGRIEADGKTVLAADLLGDALVDYPARSIAEDGAQTLELALISRDQLLFFVNEGNVCSERFLKSVWPCEDGFNNCTDVQIPVPWGVAAPPQSGGAQSGGGGFSGGVINRDVIER